MFDFGAAHRTEGDQIGVNDKGLVTHDCKMKKMPTTSVKPIGTRQSLCSILPRRES